MTGKTRDEQWARLRAQLPQDATREKVDRALASLQGHSRNIAMLRLYYGLSEEKPQSYAAIGRHYGLSASQVVDSIEKTVRLMKHPKRWQDAARPAAQGPDIADRLQLLCERSTAEIASKDPELLKGYTTFVTKRLFDQAQKEYATLLRRHDLPKDEREISILCAYAVTCAIHRWHEMRDRLVPTPSLP